MRVRQFTLFLILALAAAAAGQQPDIWKSLAKEPDWRLTDPAYLYLIIRHREPYGDILTFLHPTRQRSNWCEEIFMPEEQQKARAFEYRLTRETLQGYEVTFQPVDPIEPWTERPIAGKELKVFFPRSERKLVKLTEKMSVQGVYGSPDLKHL
jgi:hypothetical protein